MKWYLAIIQTGFTNFSGVNNKEKKGERVIWEQQ